MTLWTAPSMPAGGRILAEGDAAQNTQIALLTDNECVLISDTSGSTNNTLGNTNLSRPVAASTRYRAKGFFFYTAGTTGDIKFGLSVPSGTTVVKVTLRSGPSGDNSNTPTTVYYGYDTSVSALSAPGTGGSSGMTCELTVVFVTSTTAGNAVLQYSQATTDAGTATTLRSGSLWDVRAVEGV